MPELIPAPRQPDYADVYAGFRIETLREQFQGDFETGINACVECCDRHVEGDNIALDFVSLHGEHQQYSFAQVRSMAARVANLLRQQGIQPGQIVAGMLPRTPELLATVLGTLRAGAVYQPLFTAFGPKAIEHRLALSGASLIVTNVANRDKLDEIANCPQVCTVRESNDPLRAGDIDFRAAVDAQSDDFAPVLRSGADLMLMMSTSGTTGAAKGVPVPLSALQAFSVYMREAVGLLPQDKFWNMADPGWAYGLYYAIIGPLAIGQGITFNEAAFTVSGTYETIRRLGITSLAGAPTAYRMMMAAGEEAAASVKGRLRAVSSAGEPLNAEVVRWFASALDVPIHDHYGQTELGMVVNNHHALRHEVVPGSAGFAMPGYRVVVLDENHQELGANQPGELAIDIARSPLFWFSGYWKQDTPAIAHGYYSTGDNVELEPNGSISFIGRSDDVITSAGYRIGPFDVESALLEHPAVADVAVIGLPDPERTEIVKAFVVLSDQFKASDALREQLAQHVKRRLSAHAYPRAIEFLDALPKTPSGKLQRFVLRKMEADRRAGHP
ncbi:AMP-binding protein [Herbaspirillum seropedicae]|uniref:AMP-binding protein n=1 Tax=Herbaspirillum seropedicae TaxID=964 RepID=UPI001120168C|nr:AMP-binding protein [Herbaspirillum seropedicae]QDD63427.1 AMP-binding protein [Herbaspirillum seropedicae]